MNKVIVLITTVILTFLLVKPPNPCEDPITVRKSVTSEVLATYYHLEGTTSCNYHTEKGMLALSPELYKYYSCGDSVYFYCRGCELEGSYMVADKTHRKYTNRIDIFLSENDDKLPLLDEGQWAGYIFKI